MTAKARYQPLLEQLEAITAFDGFISTLVDIRDGMLFYDRDLMLAGYTGSVEALVVSTLATACMEGDREALEAFGEVRRMVELLPVRLRPPRDAPADVQSVTEAFMRVGAWVLRERVPAFLLSFDFYMRGRYPVSTPVDVLLGEAQRLLEQDPQAALERVGQVGALMLRGQLLRPRWFSVAQPRLHLWLSGLRNMAGHLAGTWPVFPWGPVEEERSRSRPPVVVDLEAFRRRRTAAMEAWRIFEPVEPRDEVDQLIEQVFQGPQAVDPGTVQALAARGEEPIPLLLAMAWAEPLLDAQDGYPPAVAGAVRALSRLRRHEVVPRLIELLTEPRVPEEVAQEAREGLEALGGLALDGVGEYLRRTRAPRGGPALAGVLARLPRSEKTFQALVELFRRVPWADGKLEVARALAEYGDGRAVPLLRRALRDPQLPAGPPRAELEGVLKRLAGSGRTVRRGRAVKG